MVARRPRAEQIAALRLLRGEAQRRVGGTAEVLGARRVRGRYELVDVTEALGGRRAGEAGGLGRVAGAAAWERALVSVPAGEADGEHGDGRGGVGVEASAVQPGVLRRALDEEELKSDQHSSSLYSYTN